MKSFIRDVLLVLACFCVVFGCSKRSQKAPAEDKDQAKKPEISIKIPVIDTGTVKSVVLQQPQYDMNVKHVKEEDVPFRVCATQLDAKGIPKAGLVKKETGVGSMVAEGGVFCGYEVVKVDIEKERVIFRKDGNEFTLGVSSAPVVAGEAANKPGTDNVQVQDAGKLPPPDQGAAKPGEESVDLLSMPRKQYEPTPEEKSAGIDPNNPTTWPANYKGPGLERLLKEHPQPTNQVNPVLEYIKQNPPKPEE